MAIYNEILAGRIPRAIQRLLSMKGRVPTSQVSGELMPNLNLDNVMALENRILLGVRSFARSVTVAAGGAGNRSAWRLRNPAGSNVVAVIEKIMAWGGAAGDNPFVNRGFTGGALGDLTTSDTANVSIRDVRLGPTSGSLVASSSTAAAIIGNQFLQLAFGANTQAEGIWYENEEFVIAPADQITIYSAVLNQALNINVFWRERVLEESELLVQG